MAVVMVVLVMMVVMAMVALPGGSVLLGRSRRLGEGAGREQRQQPGEKNRFGGSHVEFSDDVAIRCGSESEAIAACAATEFTTTADSAALTAINAKICCNAAAPTAAAHRTDAQRRSAVDARQTLVRFARRPQHTAHLNALIAC